MADDGQVVVCLKWVDLRPEVDPLTGASTLDPRFSGASPADWSALEWALRLAGGVDPVTVVSAGPAEAQPMLRTALAAGAANAVRIDTDRSLSSDAVGERNITGAALLGELHQTDHAGEHGVAADLRDDDDHGAG